jgi:hypothetical protein
MANVTVVSILDRANTILVDTTKSRWTYDELLIWYNDAVLEIVNIRPDAMMSNQVFTVTPNQSKQVLPSNGLRWLDVMYEVSTGRPITKTDRRQLDDQVPNWHKNSGDVRAYVFDERDPKHIYIHPQPTTAVDLMVCFSVAPTAITINDFDTDTQLIQVDDNYVSALVDFVVYRAYSKDADYAANAQRAASHYQAFMQSLGQKTQTDNAYNPRSRAEPRNA